MKKYRVASPEQMREAIPKMKDDREAKSAANVATVWSVATRQGKPRAFTIYIKIGRSATLCREREGHEIVLGGMRLMEARDFVAGLKPYEGGTGYADC